MDLVQVTGLLVAATGLLAVVSFLQWWTTRSSAKDQREATEVLKQQAKALETTALASKAVADEARAARIAANPLRVSIDRKPARPGTFEARIDRAGDRVVILRKVELFVGQGSEVGSVPVAGTTYGNSYLTSAGGQYVLEQFTAPPFDKAEGDLLVVRVTGRPADGEEQSKDFLYRILPDRTLEDMTAVEPLIS